MDDIAPSEETLNQVRRRESKRSNKQVISIYLFFN